MESPQLQEMSMYVVDDGANEKGRGEEEGETETRNGSVPNDSQILGVCCGAGRTPDPEPEKADPGLDPNNVLALDYGVDDIPAPHMCFFFGLQQVLLSISSTISIPLLVSGYICAGHLELVKSQIMSTFLVMCGVCTILQDIIGVRLPIIQGGCHKFLPAISALMTLDRWACPPRVNEHFVVDGVNVSDTEVWQVRMREIQGGIILASLTQVLVGCTGILGVLLQYLGPITIVPTISLVGLSLIGVATNFCKKHWGITFLTIGLTFLFSLYLRNIHIPFPAWTPKKKCHVIKYPVFRFLPVILAVIISWLLCWALTETGVFTDDPDKLEWFARTDARSSVMDLASWLFWPYPGQWGWPTVSASSYVAMMAATITSIIESVGDYYACARISGVPQPPAHAINRGIAIEGFGSILSGLVGSGGATTSYSQNVGAIGFTKVASRAAFVTAGVIFLVCGLVGKFGALLTMIPDPVLGGVVVISFGMVTAVGLSTLSYVDLNSGRNLCIIGSSLLIGLMVPQWLSENKGAIKTGNEEFDQVLTVLLSTSMFVGGALAFFLDNTVPGTDRERGILKWRQQMVKQDDTKGDKSRSIYDLPLITPCLRRIRCCSYVPFMPSFRFQAVSPLEAIKKRCRRSRTSSQDTRL